MGGVRKIEVEASAGAYDVSMVVEMDGKVYVKVVRGLDAVMSVSGKSVDEAAGKLLDAMREVEAALADIVKVARRLDVKTPQGVV
jgi:hypothetical protein